MRFLFLLIIIALLYMVFFRHGHPQDHGDAVVAPVAQSGATPTPPSSAAAGYLKRPLDRTHEVIDQVKKQRREDGY